MSLHPCPDVTRDRSHSLSHNSHNASPTVHLRSSPAVCACPCPHLALIHHPQEARIPVPDPRFDWLCETYKPTSRVPAFLTCIDIAGLTAGASTGAGLGNAFLSHVRAVDGIFQVVRAFDDAEVIHVEGDVDPCRDMDIISTELRLKDIEWVEKHLDGLKKTGRSLGNSSLADKQKKEEIATVQKIYDVLTKENKDVRKHEWTGKEVSVRSALAGVCFAPRVMIKSACARYNPARRRRE